MATAAILTLLFLSILVTRSTSGSSRRHYSKISLICQSAVEILLFVQKSKMASAAILDLILVIYGIRAYKTSSVIRMPNFVQICAIVNELWAIDEIQNGGRRPLEFIIFVHFGQMVYFRWQPSTLLQNFIHLRQSAAELLLFAVQAPKNHVLGSFSPPNIIFYHRDSQKALPYAEARVLSLKRSWSVFCCDL